MNIDWIALYKSFYDDLEPACKDIGVTMSKVTFVLLAISLAYRVYVNRSSNATAILEVLMPIIALVAFLSAWDMLAGNQGLFAQMGTSLASEVQQKAYNQYTQQVDTYAADSTTSWDFYTKPVETLTAFVYYLFGIIGTLVMGVAKMFQYFFIALTLAFGPLYIGLLAFNTTRGIGVNFMMSTLSLYLWDLAWRFVDLGTLNLIRVFLNTAAGNATIGQGILLTAGWVILGYIFGPVLVTKAMVAGGNIGGALVGGVMSKALEGAEIAAGAGVGGKLFQGLGGSGGGAGGGSGQGGSGGGSKEEGTPTGIPGQRMMPSSAVNMPSAFAMSGTQAVPLKADATTNSAPERDLGFYMQKPPAPPPPGSPLIHCGNNGPSTIPERYLNRGSVQSTAPATSSSSAAVAEPPPQPRAETHTPKSYRP